LTPRSCGPEDTEAFPHHDTHLGRQARLGEIHAPKNPGARAVSDSIVLVRGNNGREKTDAELEEWVAGFPIEVNDGRICPSDYRRREITGTPRLGAAALGASRVRKRH
jgi:hypothetical protein